MNETKDKKDLGRRPQSSPEIVRKPSPETATGVAVAESRQRADATADADAVKDLKAVPTPYMQAEREGRQGEQDPGRGEDHLAARIV